MVVAEKNNSCKWNTVTVCICILILVLIKVPDLHLPYYWDEAWSYAIALNEMFTHKITLLPSQVNQEIFKGHPLFFYAMTSSYAKVAGISPFYMHSWMLLLTCIGIFSFYKIVGSLYGSSVALFASVFLIFQEIIIVQSSFLLPELMIAFLSMFSFYYYIENRFWGYILFGTLLVMTKESGVIAILAVCLHAAAVMLFRKEWSANSLKRLFFCSVPLLVFTLFIFLQKLKCGWYLFPEHVSLMTFSSVYIKSRLLGFREFMLDLQNRRYYSYLFFASIPLLFLVNRKSFVNLLKDKLVLLLLIFVALYCAFSSVNFYSTRYLISLFPVLALITALSFSALIHHIRWFYFFTLSVGLFFISSYFLSASDDLGDTSKNYATVVRTQKLVFDNFVLRNLDSSFGGDFQIRTNLENPILGYLSVNSKIHSLLIEEAKFIITSCTEPNQKHIDLWLKEGRVKLVFEEKEFPAWCRVYMRK